MLAVREPTVMAGERDEEKSFGDDSKPVKHEGKTKKRGKQTRVSVAGSAGMEQNRDIHELDFTSYMEKATN
jgi:hypothetical protein